MKKIYEKPSIYVDDVTLTEIILASFGETGEGDKAAWDDFWGLGGK